MRMKRDSVSPSPSHAPISQPVSVDQSSSDRDGKIQHPTRLPLIKMTVDSLFDLFRGTRYAATKTQLIANKFTFESDSNTQQPSCQILKRQQHVTTNISIPANVLTFERDSNTQQLTCQTLEEKVQESLLHRQV